MQKLDLKTKKKRPDATLAKAYRVVFGSGFTAIILLVLSLIFRWTIVAWIAGILLILVLILLFDVIGYIERVFRK